MVTMTFELAVVTGGPSVQPNFARYTFLDDDLHRFCPDWDTAADTCVAILRTGAATS